jgi:acyl-CoA thioesterase
MIDTTMAESTVMIPHRYHTSAGAFIEAVHRAQGTVSAEERRQHIAVARIWYDTLAENLRALKHEIAETRGWISDHVEHPLLPQMRTHLASLSSDARLLDRALTDLLLALSTAGEVLCD